MKKVIIGAGPAGLYAAIKLKKAGAKEVVIYDPRAGSYTRPGHLNKKAFTKAEQGIGKQFWTGDYGHIKDLERELYREALRLGIKIEKKRFVQFQPDAKTPGIIVADEAGKEELITTNYVFDCTGSQRRVVHAVNDILPNSPLKLTQVTEVPVPNHFIAYVKMNSAQLDRLNYSYFRENIIYKNAHSFAHSIVKLRKLGWNEFKFPRCYGASFGKKQEKACLYLETPAGLTEANYDSWVQTVLECYVNPVSYEHLPPSKKYASKPRFNPINVSANALQQVSFKGKDLPTVIALGDAQIDADYSLAHGIYNGMLRIDALLESMKIQNGEIDYFDPDDYQREIEDLLSEHKRQLREKVTKIKHNFIEALKPAQLKLIEALTTTASVEKTIFRVILKSIKAHVTTTARVEETVRIILNEINARLSYERGRQVFSETHNEFKQVIFTLTTINTDIANLTESHTDLSNAWSHLPVSCELQRQDTQNLLTHLAISWKKIGRTLFKNKQFSEATKAYEKAIEIYNLPKFQGNHASKELTLYSDLTCIYNTQKYYPQAIIVAQIALRVYELCSDDATLAAIHEEIVCNLIKALCIEGQQILENGNSCYIKAKELFKTYEEVLSTDNRMQITALICELEQQLPSEPLANETTLDFPNSNTIPVATPAGSPVITSNPETSSAPLQPASSKALQKYGTFLAVNKENQANEDAFFSSREKTSLK